MPELPEVETTRRGIEPHVLGRRVRECRVHEPRLRWPISASLATALCGAKILAAKRRAKYLLLPLDTGSTLMVHLGMSGNLRVLPAEAPRLKHDHVEWLLDDGRLLRFNDPRRFGSLHLLEGDPNEHPLLAALGPEPLDETFDEQYLWRTTRGRRLAIKPCIMNGQIVVGVGNIYASEALFKAGIRPGRQARSLRQDEARRLVRAIKQVLGKAIEVGGTTLRDYVGVDGQPGYFRQRLHVYERAGEPCRRCGTLVRRRVQAQRATYWCAECQK